MQKFIETFLGCDWGGILRVVVLFLLYITYAERKTLVKVVTNLFMSKEKKRKYKNVAKLKNNPLLVYLRDWIHYEIPNLKFKIGYFDEIVLKNDKEVEKRIWNAQRTMSYKFDVVRSGISLFLDDCVDYYLKNDKINMKNSMDKNFWNNFIDDSVNAYTTKSLNGGVSPGFLDKFSKFHQKSIDNLKQDIADTIDNAPYSDYLEFLNAILDMFKSAFRSTFNHIGMVLRLNGELSEILEDWEIPNK